MAIERAAHFIVVVVTMKRLFGLVAFVMTLNACSGAGQPVRVAFSPPPGFVNVDTVNSGTKAYVNFKTRETIGLDTKYETPPPDAPPGQRVERMTGCRQLPVVLWESTHGNQAWIRYYVPQGNGSYFFVVYIRAKNMPPSPAVMHALQNACPQ